MDALQAKRVPEGDHFLDKHLCRVHGAIGWPIRIAAAELVVENDLPSVLGKAGEGFVAIMGQTGATADDEEWDGGGMRRSNATVPRMLVLNRDIPVLRPVKLAHTRVLLLPFIEHTIRRNASERLN
jgi:hypothetical protein